MGVPKGFGIRLCFGLEVVATAAECHSRDLVPRTLRC